MPRRVQHTSAGNSHFNQERPRLLKEFAYMVKHKSAQPRKTSKIPNQNKGQPTTIRLANRARTFLPRIRARSFRR